MGNWKKRVPEGTRDIIFSDCATRRDKEAFLKSLYERNGYEEVITPSIEYLDVFEAHGNALRRERMYKLCDREGRLLCLRPDNTMPIARLYAARLNSMALPVRLHYRQSVFRLNGRGRGRRDEITQSGVELIGAGGLRADIELVRLAVEAVRGCGIEGFKVELGHVGLFKSLAAGIVFLDDDFELMRSYIERKNYAALGDILDAYSTFRTQADALRELPSLFGGAEVLERAAALVSDRRAMDAVGHLRSILAAIDELGLSQYVSVDLGIVQDIDYYSGLVFRCYIDGAGETVLSGGRYDGLAKDFGYDVPGAGFAIDIDAVAQLLNGGSGSRTAPDALVHYDESSLAAACAKQHELLDMGLRCELSLFAKLDESRRYAAQRGIARLIIIDEHQCVEQTLV